MDIKKLYIPVPAGKVVDLGGRENGCTHIKVNLFYSLGGYSNWTGQNNERGYYICATPVTIRDNLVSECVFSGRKMLIVPCGRQGKKAETQAIEKFNASFEAFVRSVFPTAEVDFSAVDAA